MNHPGRVLSREELLELAWPDPGAVTDRTVDAHVKSLRAKIREAVPEFDPIETRRGLGYALKE
jgi:two-component system catabolic regulation response regulator CreB